MIQRPRLRSVLACGVLSIVCSAWMGAYFGASCGGTAAMLACFFLFLGSTMASPRWREAVPCALLGVFFAAMRVLGFSYDTIDSYGLVLKSGRTLLCALLATMALTLAAGCACLLALRLLDALRLRLLRRESADARTRRRLFAFCAAVIFCGSIPYLLLYWPGLNIYDTRDQLLQFFGHPSYIGDGSVLTDHHPVFLTVVYGLFMRLGLLLGSANVGQALYSLASMAALALCFAYALVTLYDAGLGRGAIAALALGVALYPVLALYAFNMCKDVSVEPFVLLYAAQFIRLEMSGGEVMKSRRFVLTMALTLLMLMLTRKPSFYALLLSAPFFLLRYRGVRLRLGALLLSTLLVFQVGYNGLLLPACGVEAGETREMLSIPFQQTARCLRDDGEDVTPQELEAISRVLDIEYAAEHYDPRLSDPVKDTSNPDLTAGDLAAYARAWLSMGLRHPGTYIDAWLNMIYGYFYPSESNTIVCLTLNSPDQGELTLTQDESMAGARLGLFNWVMYKLRRLPGVGALFYADWITWAFLFLLTALAVNRGWGAVCPFMFFLGTLGICLLSPKSGEIRYLMPILYVLPVLLGWVLTDRPGREEVRA
ncbi:MAG: DUF6020 family protein [Candidatus Ventricola sp.]|nr:DUF6020 family protein [Candidatus Ventricola sp.]